MLTTIIVLVLACAGIVMLIEWIAADSEIDNWINHNDNMDFE